MRLFSRVITVLIVGTLAGLLSACSPSPVPNGGYGVDEAPQPPPVAPGVAAAR
jgi:hypothetical protein